MNSKASGVYSITSKTNGKRYIGSSNRICDRWKEHIRDLKAGRHNNIHLQNHFDKYNENDLLFAVVEIVERGELSLQDFKKLLLQREQVYLDNWDECQFNCLKIAGSPLGYKKPNSKYYIYDKRSNKYVVNYILDEKATYLGCFNTEVEAINHVNFIKSLSDEDLKSYCKTNFKGRGRRVNGKNYTYKKSKNLFCVYFSFNFKKIYFGSHVNEKDAIQEVSYLKTLSDDDKIKYYETTYKGNKGMKVGTRKRGTKGYYFNNTANKWQVRFLIDGSKQSFGYFDTEEEARQKAEQVKQELGGFN